MFKNIKNIFSKEPTKPVQSSFVQLSPSAKNELLKKGAKDFSQKFTESIVELARE